MKLEIAGLSKALVVLAAPPVNPGDGTDLTQFAINGKKPSSYQGRVRLAGGVSTEFVIYVRDAVGWAIAADVGNLGLVVGQALPTGHAYGFAIEGIGSYLEVVLVTQNMNGVVVVTENTLTAVKDY